MSVIRNVYLKLGKFEGAWVEVIQVDLLPEKVSVRVKCEDGYIYPVRVLRVSGPHAPTGMTA